MTLSADAPFAYQDRVVAYIDILAWKEAVKGSAKDSPNAAAKLEEIGMVLRRLRSVTAAADVIRAHSGQSDRAHLALEVTLFSDTVVISCKPSTAALFVLFGQVRAFCLDLMQVGLFTRGAIVLDELYHRDGVFVGPAQVKAYCLENEVAVFPRILLHESVLKLLEPTPLVPIVEEDRDGLKIFNLFVDVYPQAVSADHARGLIGTVQENAKKNRDANLKNDKIRSKMGWLLTFLDDEVEKVEKAPLPTEPKPEED